MRVFSETSVKQVYVSPSAGLEFLPNNVANIKIRNIGFALKLLREV
jgi:methionine synthase II (cobalamin-independent)